LLNPSNSSNTSNNNYKFISYLTGLIEGDGTIIVPFTDRSSKGKLNYPSIQIAYHLKDLPLALLIQKKLGYGSLIRKKGLNAYTYYINDKKGILKLINLLNGNMKTPKINSLYNLIDWLNNKNPQLNLIKLPLNTFSLSKDAWLTGFIESDGHFSVRTTMTGKYPKIECKFELRKLYLEDTNLIKLNFIMKQIANYLEIKDYSFKQTKTSNYLKFAIKTQNIISNEILINYLTKYPLWSSNLLNYRDWLLSFKLYKKFKQNNKSLEILDEIKLIKKRMHDNRTILNWDHLQNFYSLNFVKRSYKSSSPFTGSFNRKYSTISNSYNNLINSNNSNKLQESNNLKLNNNLFVSSLTYNNAETEKLNILTETKNKAGVYIWTQLFSNKKYVGSSVNLSRRLTYYFSKVNIARYKKSRIHNALLHFGYSSFSLSILELIDITKII
jgi:LAGLIDADG endonuclease/GIY-YIG catalytic domain